MHPIGRWPSDPGHRALLPFSKPAATRSLPLASTTRGRHSQTDNEHDPSPISESIRALTPAASTTATDGQPRPARARHRRRAQRVKSDVGDRPQPARSTPSSARRPDRLADVVVAAALEAAQSIELARAPAEHDERHRGVDAAGHAVGGAHAAHDPAPSRRAGPGRPGRRRGTSSPTAAARPARSRPRAARSRRRSGCRPGRCASARRPRRAGWWRRGRRRSWRH
jgi:hypothetical protein